MDDRRRALHPQAEELRTRLRFDQMPPVESIPIAVSRSAPPAPCPEPIGERLDVDADGVPARLYRPTGSRRGRGGRDDAMLVWFHGGGWVLGSIESHDCLCRRLANGGGFSVLSVGYRLAPEHPFPAAIDDADAAVAWAGRHTDAVAVGGDSAGANLAAVVAQRTSVPLRHQALVYPVIDATRRSASYREEPSGFPLTASAMAWFVECYLGGTGVAEDDPRVSPIFVDDVDLARTPPALVVTAELDPLRDEGETYAARLAGAGIPTRAVRYDGMPHGFLGFADALDDARAAIALIAAEVAAALT